jgi:hypothetical protein
MIDSAEAGRRIHEYFGGVARAGLIEARESRAEIRPEPAGLAAQTLGLILYPFHLAWVLLSPVLFHDASGINVMRLFLRPIVLLRHFCSSFAALAHRKKRSGNWSDSFKMTGRSKIHLGQESVAQIISVSGR